MGKWTQALAVNNNDSIFNLAGTSFANVDTTPNSYNHSFGNTNTVRVNSDGKAECGIQFQFPDLEIGDEVELFAEVKIIRGDKPVILFGEYDKETQLQKSSTKKYTKAVYGEWQTIKLKTFVNVPFSIPNHRAMFGLEIGKFGTFEIRSVSCTVNGKGIQPLDKIDRGFYRYIIKKVAGVWTMQNGSSVGTVTQPYGWTLQLTFPQCAYPSPQITISSLDWIVGFTNAPNATTLSLACKSRVDDTSAGTQWASIPDNTILYVNITYKY